MNGLKTIQIIHAGDADQHLGHLHVFFEGLQAEKRIAGYSSISSTTVGTTSFSGLGEGDMIIMLLSDGMESKKDSIKGFLLDAQSRQPLLKVVEILVDQVAFDPRFIVLPLDLTAIRLQRDMDAAWFKIGQALSNYFPPIQEPIISTTSSFWIKYRHAVLGTLGLLLLFVFLFEPEPKLPKNVTLENFGDKFGFDKRTKEWLNAYKSTKEKLVDFYKKNESKKTKAFTEQAVETMMNDGHVDLEEAYIETETSDDTYIMGGARENVPEIIFLPNADTVLIKFGVTGSDNKSANSKVSKVLVDGIQHAVELANDNLHPDDKIKSIYVMATTNGKHGPNSNHYNGSAVDISRINDQKMVLMEEGAPQIIQLQNAFDGYSYVRENFGPAMKHKYVMEQDMWNYDFKVKGHVDHIHFSVRKKDLITSTAP